MFISILTLVAAWTIWSLATLIRNYRVAKTIGLPIVVEPVSNLSLVWLITDGIIRQIPWLRPLRDKFVKRFMPFNYFGWQFDLGYAIHEKYGPAFVHVSPGSISVSVGDSAAAYEIMSRRKDFIKPQFMYEQLNVFGPNVNTVEGEAWQRHRRLTDPSFNERVSSSVWNESRKLSQKMLDAWLQAGTAGVSTTVRDTADLALNVLTVVGFGQTGNADSEVDSKDTHSFHSAIQLILQRFVFVMISPERLLSAPFMPTFVRELGQACTQFRSYVADILAQKRQSIQVDDASHDLLTNLVRAADAEKGDKGGMGMTDREIYGNMFMFTLAGHETTANTIATAIVYLARHPSYQKWIREEIRQVTKDLTEDDYEGCFPQLKRCLAVMYETLRIHGSIVVIPRSTHSRPEILSVKGQQHTIPPNTLMWVNNHAAQTDPTFWGSKSEQWLPDRWIQHESNESVDIEGESLMQPENGSFIPWAEGPRNCLGKKFSQVEFVGAIATLFRNHTVDPVLSPASNQNLDVNGEVDNMLKDSEIGAATLQFKQPERVYMAWQAVESHE